ncbi:hypothetical protein CEY16_05110 [Halalkalibacillus sediminis]|uniref:Uroporphyrinogen-III synthase n=1 Tax=Halalkalibacillus sediminis TaxID=2018042 RepID=A0A2I0QXR8_9BACI|nr:uroporphyrinogen-III synthase [Halalkalibacillus sediminis]PKR79133.1 hypothetical protein CEY16_05110 [Halalkalibacillus sediminis]
MSSLRGKNIVVSREREHALSFVGTLERQGAEVVGLPLIKFRHILDESAQTVLENLDRFEWLLFTSVNGVRFFFESLDQEGISHSTIQSKKIAAIGSKTEDYLKEYVPDVDFVPTTFDAEHMGPQFLEMGPESVLLVKGNLSREVLDVFFKENGVEFESVTVYETSTNREAANRLIGMESVDAWVFSSPSTIDAWMELSEDSVDVWLTKPCFCIGPTTAQRAQEVGFETVILPENYTLDELADIIVDCYERGML